MSWREGNGVGDVDGALDSPFHWSEVDLHAFGHGWRQHPLEGDVASTPRAKVLVCLDLRFFRGDVAYGDEVGDVGPEVLRMVSLKVFLDDGLQTFLGHDLAVGMQLAVIDSSDQVAGDFSRGGSNVGQVGAHLGFHLVQLLLRKRGVEDRVRHNLEQGVGVLGQRACRKSTG